MRPAGLPAAPPSPSRRAGEVGGLRQRADALLGEEGDALAGGDAGLHGLLDAGGHGGELVAHDRAAAGRVTLDGLPVAPHGALDARARTADVPLELVAGAVPAALEARLQPAELALRGLGRAVAVDQRRDALDDAVARLERGADVHQRGALGERTALGGGHASGGGVGLGGLTSAVGRGGAGATTGRLRRRLGGRLRRGGRTGARRAARAGRTGARRAARGALARRGRLARGLAVVVGGLGHEETAAFLRILVLSRVPEIQATSEHTFVNPGFTPRLHKRA